MQSPNIHSIVYVASVFQIVCNWRNVVDEWSDMQIAEIVVEVVSDSEECGCYEQLQNGSDARTACDVHRSATQYLAAIRGAKLVLNQQQQAQRCHTITRLWFSPSTCRLTRTNREPLDG